MHSLLSWRNDHESTDSSADAERFEPASVQGVRRVAASRWRVSSLAQYLFF
jgi:hypothetical protein